jgi:hypothetical protein
MIRSRDRNGLVPNGRRSYRLHECSIEEASSSVMLEEDAMKTINVSPAMY